MSSEKIKTMLFEVLYKASMSENSRPLFCIGRDVLSGFDDADLRTFMYSEITNLTLAHPYRAQYIGIESGADNLAVSRRITDCERL